MYDRERANVCIGISVGTQRAVLVPRSSREWVEVRTCVCVCVADYVYGSEKESVRVSL